VVLRVKAVLRRGRPREEQGEMLEAGPVRVDVRGHRVWVDEEEVVLTATEFRLLSILVERCGRVQSRSQLLQDVWEYTEEVDSRTVDTHVRRLRRKLGDAGPRIETVVGVGYRLQP
jgi:two-component system phosphate regulon response regulator PhoB